MVRLPESKIPPINITGATEQNIDLKAQVLAHSRVLWVDDHPDNNSIVRHFFEKKLGITFHIAKSTNEALKQLGDKSQGSVPGGYDLVITTFSRQNEPTGGFDLLTAIRTNYHWIPVIIYAKSADTIRQQGMALGADGITSDPQELFDLSVRALLRR